MENIANNYDTILTQLLDEDISTLEDRVFRSFDTSEEKIKKYGIVLYGCGSFGKKVLKGLRKIGIEPIGFVESNEKLWGSTVEGLKIFSPEEAVSKYPNSVFMLTIWSDINGHPFDDAGNKLNKYGQVNLVSFFHLFWKYPNVFLPYFSIDLPSKTLMEANLISDCYSLFQDEVSKKEFVAQIKWRLWGDHKGLTAPVDYVQYFPNDLFEIKNDEVFVDCGAFDGDTLKNFIEKTHNNFEKYFGFEPDPINYLKLNTFVSELPQDIRDKIVVEQYGVSDTRKTIKFNSDGSVQSSFSDSGNISVVCISVDEHIGDQSVSYIKMDAEGAEPEIITGARETIKNNSPILAISVYHQVDHLWALPLLVRSIAHNYRFFLRPHCYSSWDLICYAVPVNRLKSELL